MVRVVPAAGPRAADGGGMAGHAGGRPVWLLEVALLGGSRAAELLREGERRPTGGAGSYALVGQSCPPCGRPVVLLVDAGHPPEEAAAVLAAATRCLHPPG